MKTVECFGCKAVFEKQSDVQHYQFAGIGKYGIAVPECLASFFAVLSRESELFGYPPAHRLVVDAYAIQHPRRKEWQKKFEIEPRLVRASIQSVTVHLMMLYWAIEKNIDLHEIASITGRMLQKAREDNFEFIELEPPKDLGAIKVDQVKKIFFAQELSLQEYTQLMWDWAQSAWDAWSYYHETIQKLCEKYGE